MKLKNRAGLMQFSKGWFSLRRRIFLGGGNFLKKKIICLNRNSTTKLGDPNDCTREASCHMSVSPFPRRQSGPEKSGSVSPNVRASNVMSPGDSFIPEGKVLKSGYLTKVAFSSLFLLFSFSSYSFPSFLHLSVLIWSKNRKEG